MELDNSVAWISFGSAVLGGLVAATANYLVSRREFSRSGARLHADLEILEKARSLQLDDLQIKAIENYVREGVTKHTHIKPSAKRAKRSTALEDRR